ncbi:rhomboid family intramembrane serine protease [Ideonella sp. DXS29W]|uniref:Rhomboid family intramembrane serine protease n=1 Tax=Ideonella lacteola TaxID=2984193 RepID=A0ABU9BSD1_9BURK
MPPVTKALLLICTAVFCVSLLLPIGPWLSLQPVSSGAFWPWQPLTFALLHHDPLELFFNMLGLWMFGADLERLWGWKRFGQFLLVCVLTAAVTALALMWVTDSFRGTGSGASAALYGLLFATAMLFPDRTIMPLFPPIPMKMKTFVIVFGAMAFVLNLASSRSVVELAMLTGALGAWLHIRYWRSRARRPRRVH